MGDNYLGMIRSVVEVLFRDTDEIRELIESARMMDEVPFAVERAKRSLKAIIENVENVIQEVEASEAREVLEELLEELTDSLRKLEECQKNAVRCRSDEGIDLECVDCLYDILIDTSSVLQTSRFRLDKVRRRLQRDSEGGTLLRSKKKDREKSLADSKRLQESIEHFRDFSRGLEAISSVFDSVSGSIKVLRNMDDRAVFILDLLLGLSESERGAYVGDILSAVTGLSSVTADPVDRAVKIRLPRKNESEEDSEQGLPLQTIFYRYSPFEPISLEEENGISGSHVWFVKIKNRDYYFHNGNMYVQPSSLRFNPKEPIHKANLSDVYKTVGAIYPEHIFNIEPVNVLDAGDGYIILAVSLDSDKSRRKERVYIKYGSEFLKKVRGRDKDAIRDLYIKRLRAKNYRGKIYEPTDLTYAWYCTSGYGLSTDPLDVECPFKNLCKYGKRCGGSKWKRSRTLFPKVFLDVKRDYIGIGKASGLLSPVVKRNVLIEEEFPSAHLTMPKSGLPVVFNFEVPFRRQLPKTNVIGFKIAPQFLELVVRTVLDEKAMKSPELAGILRYRLWNNGPEVRLGDVLLTKFFIYDRAERGFRTYELFGRTSESLLREYRKVRNSLLKDDAQGSTFKKFLEWATKTVLHSLAHVFLSYISVELQIEESNLVYLYDWREGLVLVAENSPIGAIDIIGALGEWCESKGVTENCYLRFVDEFLRREFEFLRTHEEDTAQYADRVRSIISSLSREDDLKSLREAIIELYNEFLKEGLVLDVHSLSTHLLLSTGGQTNLERLIDSKNLDVDSQKAHRYFDDVLLTAIPNYCVDGCTTCVVVNRGCTEGLGQTYAVSRKLLEFTIGVLLGRYPLRGPGGSYLKTLLNIAGESVEAMSPYLDKEGVETLTELAKRGVRVKLFTRPKFAREYSEELKNAGIEVVEVQDEHDKWYCIDGRLLIKPTANMNLSSESYNSFTIKLGGCS